MQTDGIFFDGEVAASRAVTVTLEAGGLRFSGPETRERHWTLTQLMAATPPQAGRPLRLTAMGHPGARLIIPDDGFAAALISCAPHVRAAVNRAKLGRLAPWSAAGLAIIVAVLYLVLQFAPQHLAFALPDSWRDRVGTQIEAALTHGAKLCGNAPGLAAVAALAARLAEGNPNLPAGAIKVYDVPVMNAFAMPGGRIVITRELIAGAASPDDVAGVLAHELGHVFNRHPEAQLVRQTGFQVLIGALTNGNGNTMSSIAGLAAILRFSREAEAEADDFALAALAASEIDPMGLKRFFEVALKEEGKHRAGTFSKIEPAFSTHPGTEERIKKIAPLPAGATSRPALSGEQWQALQKICGP